MKFNSFELIEIATKKYPKFEKEGPLYFKDFSSNGANKKGYIECYGKLKGNILFIFKGKEKINILHCLLILERFNVQLIDDDLQPEFYNLLINFDSGFDSVQIGSKNESERDSWLSHIYISSYECMRIQLSNLQEQVGNLSNNFIGFDDVSNHYSMNSIEYNETFYEVILSCLEINLKYLFSYSNKMNSFVEMFIEDENKQTKFYGRTETIENTNSPTFHTSIKFNMKLITTKQFSFKFIIYHVIEMMTGMNIPVAFSILSYDNIIMLKEKRTLNIKLSSYSNEVIGTLIIRLNKIDSDISQRQSLHYRSNFLKEILNNCFCNPVSHTFYFKNKANDDIRVVESLKEFLFAFSIPESYLQHKIEQEREKMKLLKNIRLLDKKIEDRKLMPMIAFYESIISTYEQHRQYLHTHLNDSFKASSRKSHKEVLFVPTNLHLQSLKVSPFFDINADETYNVVTVGVFTACALKYKNGGLYRLYQRDSSNEIHRFMKMDEHMRKFVLIKRTFNDTCMHLCSAANLASVEKMSQQLVTLHSIIEDLSNECTNFTMNVFVSNLFCQTERSDCSWKWNGTDLVKSNIVDPWNLTCTNISAALICIVTSIEQLLKSSNDAEINVEPPPGSTWLDTIGPLIIKLQRCVEFCCETATSAIVYNNLVENMEKQVILHTLKQRKDAVFCQALTSIAASLVCFLNDLTPAKLAQIESIGLLNQFESLISCHGDEKGMLEDMMIAITELDEVTFSINQQIDENKTEIKIDYDAYENCIKFYLPRSIIDNSLFKNDKDKYLNHSFKMINVLFNIGINEQASFAERWGNLTLQEESNKQNLIKFQNYYSKYKEFLKQKDWNLLNSLFESLTENVKSTEKKNVSILQISSRITRLINGYRFTCCKSAKDRTAMSITLEEKYILESNHEITSPFIHNIFRSEGVRRDNVEKNTGTRKYAFNAIQLLYLPSQYRPPHGTYGNVEG